MISLFSIYVFVVGMGVGGGEVTDRSEVVVSTGSGRSGSIEIVYRIGK